MVGNRKLETPSHSLLKHLIASLLEREGHKIKIEYEIPGVGIVDVMDFTDGLAYEVQTKLNEKIWARPVMEE